MSDIIWIPSLGYTVASAFVIHMKVIVHTLTSLHTFNSFCAYHQKFNLSMCYKTWEKGPIHAKNNQQFLVKNTKTQNIFMPSLVSSFLWLDIISYPLATLTLNLRG